MMDLLKHVERAKRRIRKNGTHQTTENGSPENLPRRLDSHQVALPMTSMKLLVRPLAGVLFLLWAAAAAAKTTQDRGIDYATARRDRRPPASRAQGPIVLDVR